MGIGFLFTFEKLRCVAVENKTAFKLILVKLGGFCQLSLNQNKSDYFHGQNKLQKD